MKKAPDLEPLPIPEEAMEDCGIVMGRRGVGKSNTLMVLFERELDKGHRTVMIDPKGDRWGYRFNPDRTTSRFADVPIFGGRHGDYPLTADMGEMMGTLVAESDLSCLIDLSQMSLGEKHKFMLKFAPALLQKNRAALTLFIEEVDQFANQDPRYQPPMLVHHIANFGTLGRQLGIVLWSASQRPAKVNATVRSQADTFVGMRVTLPLDRKAYREWFEGHGKDAANKVDAEIGKLSPGEAMVWVGATDFFERVQFPRASTYDSGRTPKHGEAIDNLIMPKLTNEAIAKMIEAAMPKPEQEEQALASMSDSALAAQTALIAKHLERIKFLEQELEKSLAWGSHLAHCMERSADAARDLAEQLEAPLPKSKADVFVQTEGTAGTTDKPWPEKLFGMTEDEKERYRQGFWNHPDDATPPVNHGISKRVAEVYKTKPETAAAITGNGAGATPLRVNDPANFSPSIRKILAVFEALAPRPVSLKRAALLGGISPKSSAFNRHLEATKATGLIEPHPIDDEWSWAGPVDPNRPAIDPVSTWTGMLKGAPSAMLQAIASSPVPLERNDAAIAAGISPTSSNVGKAIKELLSLKLIVALGSTYTLAEDMRI